MGNLRDEFENRRKSNREESEARNLAEFRLIDEFDSIIKSDDFFKNISTRELYSSLSPPKRYYGFNKNGERKVFEVAVIDHNYYYDAGDTIFHREELVRQGFGGNIIYFPSHAHNRVNSKIHKYFSDPKEAAIHAAGIIGDGKDWTDVCLSYTQIDELKRYRETHPEIVYILKFIYGIGYNLDKYIIAIFITILISTVVYKYVL